MGKGCVEHTFVNCDHLFSPVFIIVPWSPHLLEAASVVNDILKAWTANRGSDGLLL